MCIRDRLQTLPNKAQPKPGAKPPKPRSDYDVARSAVMKMSNQLQASKRKLQAALVDLNSQ
eukprot:13730924-Alexandrium_andersonii.AAC.1